jgi:hypothetical protein
MAAAAAAVAYAQKADKSRRRGNLLDAITHIDRS